MRRNSSNAHPTRPSHPESGSQPKPAAILSLKVWGATDKGRKREGNEDAVYPHSGSDTFPFEPGPERLKQKGQLLVVADGVGGAQAGREASHWAIRVAIERYYDLPGPDVGDDLRTAIEVANTSLHQYLQSTGTGESGSTMTAAVIRGNTLYVANVGDSRAYLIRNGQITQLTRDHTLTQRKVDQGLIRPEDAEMDPDRNVLIRSMGAGPTVQVDLFPPLELAPGDVVLLSSDGLTDMLGDEEIARLVKGNSPKRAARRLVAAANKRGGLDNISVAIARVDGETLVAGGGLLSFARNVPRDIRRMSRGQKVTLTLGGILVTLALCAMTALGWWMYGGNNDPTPTPEPTLPAETAFPSATTPAGAPGKPTAAETATEIADRPTSTPAPTITLTYTSSPPTKTPTFTPTPETPTPTPDTGGGDIGGGDGGGDGGGGDDGDGGEWNTPPPDDTRPIPRQVRVLAKESSQ